MWWGWGGGLQRTLCRRGFFFFEDLLIFFLPALGLRGCSWALSSCGGWGLLMVAAPLAAEHGPEGVSGCGSLAWLP